MASSPTILKGTGSAISPLFISHGSPTLPFDDVPARRFLSELGSKVAPAPKAILAVSAHWTTAEPTVSLAETPETIHDFYGFPAHMYEVSPHAEDSYKLLVGQLCLRRPDISPTE